MSSPADRVSLHAIPHFFPSFVGVVFGDGSKFGGFFAEILLIDDAVLINDEAHHTADAVLRWEGKQRDPLR